MTVARRRAVAMAIATFAFLALLAAGALAFWSAQGEGSAGAQIGSPEAVTVSAAPQSGIYPGSSVALALIVSNPNSYAVRIGSFSLDPASGEGGFSVDSGHSGCQVSALGYQPEGGGWTVPPREGNSPGTLSLSPGRLTMSEGASSACQGAAFTVGLKARPQ